MSIDDELPYCELCNINTDKFDYRFDYPVCIDCVENYNLEPEED